MERTTFVADKFLFAVHSRDRGAGGGGGGGWAGTAQHFCDWGGRGLNKMPKAFLTRAAGASIVGGSGGMLPQKIFLNKCF